MAKKQKEKKQSLLSLETTDHVEFHYQLKQMGIYSDDWDNFKKDLAKQISIARAGTIPMLNRSQLGAKIGVNKVSICAYENGTRLPQMFNLWLVAEACGRKLKITLE